MDSVARRVLPALLLVPGLATGGAVAAAAPAQAEATTPSFVTMVSETGDYIGGGSSRLWRTGSGTVQLSGNVDGEVAVSVSGGASGDSFGLSFAAPPGESLAAGQYDDAQRTPFRTGGHPGIDVSGDGRGCNTTSGRFTVLDVDPALTRLWLVYEEHCEGGGPALFGEVRINEPDDDPDVMVAPDRVDWPDAYPGAPGRPVPVRIVNTGTAPLSVTGAAVTDGSADFSILGNACGTVAVGDSCAVTVGFTPTTSGARHGTLTIHDSSAGGTHTVALAGRGIPGHTSFAMHSQPGDYIGGGRDWAYTPRSSPFSASGTPSLIHASAGGWDVDLEADSGHLLLPGTTFTGATRYPFNATTEPGLAVTGHGGACNTLTGSFTIQEATYDEGDHLQQLRLTFEQHCEGAEPALYGSFAWRADQPADPVPVGVSVSTDRAHYAYRHRATVTATLSSPQPGRTVSIYATPYGGARTLLVTGSTDAQGRLATRTRVDRRTTFTAVVEDQDVAGPDAGSTEVAVAARLTAAMEKALRKSGSTYLYRAGRTASMRTVVSPDHRGDCVVFQLQSENGGRWGHSRRSDCVELSRASAGRILLRGDRRLVGLPLRLRAQWAGDTESRASHSPWRYLRFVR